MKSAWMSAMTSVMVLFAAHSAWAGSTRCTLDYSIAGWSVMYSSASGDGTITCDNGQSVGVSLRAKGGGLTAGMKKVVNGHGTFSPVTDIDELFGSYASVEAHAGMGESSSAQVVTKGTVSLAFSGAGEGIDLGVTFGNFVIERHADSPHKRTTIDILRPGSSRKPSL